LRVLFAVFLHNRHGNFVKRYPLLGLLPVQHLSLLRGINYGFRSLNLAVVLKLILLQGLRLPLLLK
jgi:hypothetical protein